MRQAVILAAGRGSRMSRPDPRAVLDEAQRAVADAGGKALMPFRGRPFLDYVLRELHRAGIERAVLVVAPGDDELWRRYSAAAGESGSKISLSTVVQESPRGTADAVLCSRRLVGRQPFLLINSDNFYPAAALAALVGADAPACLGLDLAAVVAAGRSNLSPSRLAAWAALEVDGSGHLARIHEKPTAELVAGLAPPVLASPNAWWLTAEIYEACERIPPSPRGEYELPQAVQYGVEVLGWRVRVVASDAPILDLSTRADVGLAARLLPPW